MLSLDTTNTGCVLRFYLLPISNWRLNIDPNFLYIDYRLRISFLLFHSYDLLSSQATALASGYFTYKLLLLAAVNKLHRSVDFVLSTSNLWTPLRIRHICCLLEISVVSMMRGYMLVVWCQLRSWLISSDVIYILRNYQLLFRYYASLYLFWLMILQ